MFSPEQCTEPKNEEETAFWSDDGGNDGKGKDEGISIQVVSHW